MDLLQPAFPESVAADCGLSEEKTLDILRELADYGVEAPNLGFVSVEPTGDVEFLLVLERA